MDKFTQTLTLIDAAHVEDPKKLTTSTSPTPIPYELHYANKMTKYLSQRAPNASDLLRLAIRAQHLKRWEVPRTSYPATKIGYHSWRSFLQKRQADLVMEMCTRAGYGTEEAERVGALVRKEGLRAADDDDDEVQVLEDVACLVFLDDQFEEFERGYDEEKVVGILRKTWAKMSARGRELALGIEMSDRARGLVGKALEG
ncbi:hypothetical protein FE257_000357 [Aspergillus nanangensis]|uniref:Glutamyl-tRNA synthetase n=1 Tax=Aspergillus nanangensis TaxID=2582783 RepID=A0AAD4H062_ASPNN|nr:hypothetical protein FE257_000357 [Aspergillus nanangensis]